MEAGGKQYTRRSIGLHILDTRGQIKLNEKEDMMVKTIIDGKLKQGEEFRTREKRYPHLLWEFWKSDAELFPEEIIDKNQGINKKPHCVVFVFDGNLDDVPNGEEETEFYRKIIIECRDKGYKNPFILISKIDLFENKLRKKFFKLKMTAEEVEDKINLEKNKLIQKVSQRLGI